MRGQLLLMCSASYLCKYCVVYTCEYGHLLKLIGTLASIHSVLAFPRKEGMLVMGHRKLHLACGDETSCCQSGDKQE